MRGGPLLAAIALLACSPPPLARSVRPPLAADDPRVCAGRAGFLGSEPYRSEKPLLADVDGDGISDLVEASSYGPVTWRRAAAPGVYGAARTLLEKSDAAMVLAAQLDDDGADELLLLGYQGAVRLDGAHAQPLSRPLGDLGTIAVDLDRDGRDEIAALDRDGVGIYRVEAPTVRRLALYPGVGRIGGLRALDVDANGAPDVLAVTSDGTMLLVNDGTGKLSRRFVLPEVTAFAGTLADADGDGLLDLLVSGWGTRVLLGAAGGFRDGGTLAAYGDPVVADVDRDGVLDVLLESAAPSFLRGLGGGRFASTPGFLVGTSAAMLDLDGDGISERVLATHPPKVSRWLPDGTLPYPLRLSSPEAWRSRSLLTDLDGDGRKDVLTHGFTGDHAVTHLYLGAASGAPREVAPPDLAWGAPVAADLDGDGDTDLLDLDRQGELWLHRNDGAAHFTILDLGRVPVSGELAPGSVTDADGDGELDALVAPWSGAPYWVLSPLHGARDTVLPTLRAGPDGFDLRGIADVDRDGRLDLIGWSAGPVTLRAKGDGGWEQLAGPDGAACADLDGDGRVECVGAGLKTIFLQHRLEDGAWSKPEMLLDETPPPEPPSPYGAPLPERRQTAVRLVDADGDGRLDIVATWASELRLLLDDGGGRFAPPIAAIVPYQDDAEPRSGIAKLAMGGGPLQAGDVNGDGRPDLLIPGGVLVMGCTPR